MQQRLWNSISIPWDTFAVAVGRDYLGSYRLIRLVRVGHTCQVWEAIDERLQRRCAIKALQKEHIGDRQELAILKNEYEVGKTLKHKHIIETYDFIIDHDLPFLVLEFFQSHNLKQLLRQSSELLDELAPIAVEKAALGLAYLHGEGWIHRDVKPDNILINEQGDTKIIDFAIAYKPPTGLGKLFAMKSKVQGTRSYMSPEQIRGAALDERADVYSFGCVVYELFAGKPPFTAVSANELLNKHIHAPVPVLAVANRNVTPEFSDLVASMMAKKPENRPGSMTKFLTHYGKMRPLRSQRKPGE